MVTLPVYKEENDTEIIWPLRCSHRGGGQEMPENTLEAFENSLAQNIRYLEMDIHLTADN